MYTPASRLEFVNAWAINSLWVARESIILILDWNIPTHNLLYYMIDSHSRHLQRQREENVFCMVKHLSINIPFNDALSVYVCIIRHNNRYNSRREINQSCINFGMGILYLVSWNLSKCNVNLQRNIEIIFWNGKWTQTSGIVGILMMIID